MRLLVLGGTWFLGRTVVEDALRRGWSVTTFNRGRTSSDVQGVDAIRGDRTVAADVRGLASSGRWDAVVDSSGQEPTTVQLSARALAECVERYVYVSTVNVYVGWPDQPLTDDSPVRSSRPDLRADDPDIAAGLGGVDDYGRLKAGCELAAIEAFGNRTLVVRPGIILGPYEYVGRLPWLLQRMAHGGQVLAAGDPNRAIQPIDVRDLTGFILDSIEHGTTGAMNATAPIGHSTYGELLRACRQVTGNIADLVWVDDDWLAAQDVRQWSEIPLWRTTAGAWQVRSDQAWRAGLTCRPLLETVTDTWQWLQHDHLMPHARQDDIGIDPAKEQRLLAIWQRKKASTLPQ